MPRAALSLVALAACGAPVRNPPLPDAFSDCVASDGDPVEVTGLTVDGDTAVVDVTYSGGCAEHEFTLCWPDQSFQESDPVQARLDLYHDANGDTCEAGIIGPVEIDLAPLRDAWIDAYGGSTGTIVIHVGEFTADYTF
jgi:hypothetical protein